MDPSFCVVLLDKTSKGCPEWQRVHHGAAKEYSRVWCHSVKHPYASEDYFFCWIADPGGEGLNSTLQAAPALLSLPTSSKSVPLC